MARVSPSLLGPLPKASGGRIRGPPPTAAEEVEWECVWKALDGSNIVGQILLRRRGREAEGGGVLVGVLRLRQPAG